MTFQRYKLMLSEGFYSFYSLRMWPLRVVSSITCDNVAFRTKSTEPCCWLTYNGIPCTFECSTAFRHCSLPCSWPRNKLRNLLLRWERSPYTYSHNSWSRLRFPFHPDYLFLGPFQNLDTTGHSRFLLKLKSRSQPCCSVERTIRQTKLRQLPSCLGPYLPCSSYTFHKCKLFSKSQFGGCSYRVCSQCIPHFLSLFHKTAGSKSWGPCRKDRCSKWTRRTVSLGFETNGCRFWKNKRDNNGFRLLWNVFDLAVVTILIHRSTK